MRSATSCFDLTLCKKNVTRFWPLWAGYLLIWLTAMPLRALTLLQYQRVELGNDYDPLTNFAQGLAWDMKGLALVMAVAFGVMIAMAMFSHLYSPRSANFVGSLPITRDGVFVTQYLTGLAFLVIPNLAVFLLTLAIEGAAGCLYIQPLLAWLAMTCSMGFFFYSFAVLMGQIAGHLLALPVFYGIFNGLAAGLYLLIELLMDSFYYGFASMGDGAARVVLWLTPIYQLSEVSPRYTMTANGLEQAFALRNGWYLAAYTAVALAFAVLSWLGYRMRRLESAGDVVAVKWVRPVFKYSVAFCAGLSFGMVTSRILGLGVTGLVVCVVLWAAAGCFVAQMILDKSFKVFAKWRGPAAMAAVMLLLSGVVLFDLTGFETRVPKAADVEWVTISGLNSYPQDGGDRNSVVSDDPAIIAAAIDLHRAAIAQRDGDGGDWDDATGYTVRYDLNNGTAISRRYATLRLRRDELNTPGTAAAALNNLLQNRDYVRSCYGLDDEALPELADSGLVDYVSFGGVVDRLEVSGHSQGNDLAMELCRAILADFEAGTVGGRTVFDEQPPEYATVYLDLRKVSLADTLNESASSSVDIYYGDETLPAGAVIRRSLIMTITPEAANSWPVFLELYQHYLAESGEGENGSDVTARMPNKD